MATWPRPPSASHSLMSSDHLPASTRRADLHGKLKTESSGLSRWRQDRVEGTWVWGSDRWGINFISTTRQLGNLGKVTYPESVSSSAKALKGSCEM